MKLNERVTCHNCNRRKERRYMNAVARGWQCKARPGCVRAAWIGRPGYGPRAHA